MFFLMRMCVELNVVFFSSNLHHKFKGTHLGRYHLAITSKDWLIVQEHYSDLIPQIG
jgi:hypothetical protein